MKLEVNIKKAIVFQRSGTDIITLIIDDNNEAFPTMKYNTTIKIETEKDFGEKYCRNVLKIEPTVKKID